MGGGIIPRERVGVWGGVGDYPWWGDLSVGGEGCIIRMGVIIRWRIIRMEVIIRRGVGGLFVDGNSVFRLIFLIVCIRCLP